MEAIDDVRKMEEVKPMHQVEETDHSSDIDALNVDTEERGEGHLSQEEDEDDDEDDEEPDIDEYPSDTIYCTQEKQRMRERKATDFTDSSLLPEDWLKPESPLLSCASLTEPTIYYSSNSCLLSGPHEGSCNILPSLAISTLYKSTTTHAVASTTKKGKASKSASKAKENTLDSLIYLLAAKLPQNIKHRIFALLVEAWDGDRPWPIKTHNGYGISLARRYFGSVTARAFRNEEAKEMEWPKDSIDESHFELNSLKNGMLIGQSMIRHEFPKWRSVSAGDRVGALDYFKYSEYTVLQGFTRALEHFEGRVSSIGGGGKVHVKNIEHPAYQRRRELGILKDFTSFFWDNVVVDLRASSFRGRTFSGKELYQPMQPCPDSHKVHHSQISHIALNITVDAVPSTKRVSENNQQFIRLCRNINTSCGEFNSVVLYLSIKCSEMDLMMKNPLNYRAWIRSVQKLKVAAGGSMEVKLLLLRSEDGLIVMQKQKAKQTLQTREAWLSDLLMPHTVNERGLEKDGFGLERLFMEHEHEATTNIWPAALIPEKEAACSVIDKNVRTKKQKTLSKVITTIKKPKADVTEVVLAAKRYNPASDDTASYKKQKFDGTQLAALGKINRFQSEVNIPAVQKKQTVLSAKKVRPLDNKFRLSSTSGLTTAEEKLKTVDTIQVLGGMSKSKRTALDEDTNVAHKKQRTEL